MFVEFLQCVGGLRSEAEYDAILFHQWSFTWLDAPRPRLRRPVQRYVHWMFESPAHRATAQAAWLFSLSGQSRLGSHM